MLPPRASVRFRGNLDLRTPSLENVHRTFGFPPYFNRQHNAGPTLGSCLFVSKYLVSLISSEI